MSRILFLAGAYYPEPKANGICCEKVITELQERGHQVDMVAFAPNWPAADNTEINGVKIHYVRGSMYYRTLRAEETGKFTGIMLKLRKLQLKLTHLLLAFSWPNTAPLANIQFYKKACELHEKNSYDAVVAVNSPFNALHAAEKFKRKFHDVKYIAYFLDALSGGALPPYLTQKSGLHKGLKWENKLLRQADAVIVMKAHVTHLKKYSSEIQYGSRINVLDIPLIRPVPSRPSAEDGKNHIVFVGAVNAALRNPVYVLKMVEKIPNCVVDFYGSVDKLALLKEFVDRGVAVVHGKVSHEEALEAEQKADFLLNIGNRNTSLVPSKIFEYISTGKPIITTCPIDNEPSLPYLREYGMCFEVYEKQEKLKENTEKLCQFIQETRGQRVSSEFIKEHFKGNMPGSFADTLEQILKE